MAYDYATDAESPPPAPRRRRRRIRSSSKFWVFFVIIVLGGIAAGAALFGSDDASKPARDRVATNGDAGDGDGNRTTEPTTTTTFALPFREYEVTDGVNIREGPRTTYAVVGTVETGHKVWVMCSVSDGETIDGPKGPTNSWVKVLYDGAVGYITNQYVDTRADINDPLIIGVCPEL